MEDKKEDSSWEYEPDGDWAKDEYLLLNQNFHHPNDHAFAYQL